MNTREEGAVCFTEVIRYRQMNPEEMVLRYPEEFREEDEELYNEATLSAKIDKLPNSPPDSAFTIAASNFSRSTSNATLAIEILLVIEITIPRGNCTIKLKKNRHGEKPCLFKS